MNIPIKHLSLSELEAVVVDAGLPKFRYGQLLEWLYSKHVRSYEEMTSLPKAMREQFAVAYPLTKPDILDKRISVDGSRKYLLRLDDGALIETVGLPSDDGRLSVCVSSQSGCAMRCAFCATGQAGFKRNLFPGEIVDQVIAVQEDFNKRVSNVVIMGQGEPFANYQATLDGLRILNHPKLLNIGARHITVSTCGVTGGIDKLSNEPEQFTLAVSLHSARQQLRDTLMPGVSAYNLERLRLSLEEYADKTGRRFSFEYALMRDVNDAEEDLRALITYCRGLLCHVNLIPLNEIDGSPFKPASHSTLLKWEEALENNGIAVSVRKSRGADISGACGQLASQYV